MKIGTVIKDIRQKFGIKQFELASMCELSQTYLSQIESNLKDPNMSTLKNIAEALKIPLPILFYLSLDENDISDKKREAFKIIDGPVKSLIKEFFTTT
jgi:transcriptional regulator with XRE-family HTH domain